MYFTYITPETTDGDVTQGLQGLTSRLADAGASPEVKVTIREDRKGFWVAQVGLTPDQAVALLDSKNTVYSPVVPGLKSEKGFQEELAEYDAQQARAAERLSKIAEAIHYDRRSRR